MPYAILSAVLIWLVLMPVHFRTKQSASKLPTLIAKVVPTLMAAAFAGAAAFSGASASVLSKSVAQARTPMRASCSSGCAYVPWPI